MRAATAAAISHDGHGPNKNGQSKNAGYGSRVGQGVKTPRAVREAAAVAVSQYLVVPRRVKRMGKSPLTPYGVVILEDNNG
jgi:hypothetical protein